MNTISQAIIKTLQYAQIFHSPLSKSELFTKLQTKTTTSLSHFASNLDNLIKQKIVYYDHPFYSLSKNYQKNPNKTIKLYRQKLLHLTPIIKVIAKLPFIDSLFLTGSISVYNPKKSDDIDLMIISQPKRLWLLRPLVLIILSLFHKRRKPYQNQVSNLLCPNLFLDRYNLTLPHQKQNLYSANELIQAQPLILSANSQKDLYRNNLWIKRYLPNALSSKLHNQLHVAYQQTYKYMIEPQIINNNLTKKLSFLNFIFTPLNLFFYHIQFFYMKSKITNEIVDIYQAFFHPQDLCSVYHSQSSQK